jgi:signal transduction histidine kinase
MPVSLEDKYKEVLTVYITASIIFLVLAGIVVFILLFYQKKRFQHRQQLIQLKHSTQEELLKAQLESQEDAFRQIANELHDNVGQVLSSTRILLAITERSLAEVPDSLRTAGESLAKAIKDLRSLSKSLNREWLGRFNLIDNLKAEAERINVARTVRVEVQTELDQLPLEPEQQVMLFRIIQEALQNAIRHAEATLIRVAVETGDASLKVRVADDGKGILPGDERPLGLGLLNMQYRTRLLGGSIDWEPAPGGGTFVNISLPVKIP